MLQFASIAIAPHYEPPRPALVPRKRVQIQRPSDGLASEHVIDWGLEPFRQIRLSSSGGQGIVTTAERDALLALYETGRPFSLTTDLFKPLGGEPDTYLVRFELDRGSGPLFTPVTPDGELHYFDISLRVQ